jgi:hypothetical protein
LGIGSLKGDIQRDRVSRLPAAVTQVGGDIARHRSKVTGVRGSVASVRRRDAARGAGISRLVRDLPAS